MIPDRFTWPAVIFMALLVSLVLTAVVNAVYFPEAVHNSVEHGGVPNLDWMKQDGNADQKPKPGEK